MIEPYKTQMTEWEAGCKAALAGTLSLDLPSDATDIYLAAYCYVQCDIMQPATEAGHAISPTMVEGLPWSASHAEDLLRLTEHADVSSELIVVGFAIAIARKIMTPK